MPPPAPPKDPDAMGVVAVTCSLCGWQASGLTMTRAAAGLEEHFDFKHQGRPAQWDEYEEGA